jgi:hypothetical protein
MRHVAEIGVTRTTFDNHRWFLETAAVGDNQEKFTGASTSSERARIEAAKDLIGLAAHRVGRDKTVALAIIGATTDTKGVSSKERRRIVTEAADYEATSRYYYYDRYVPLIIEAIASELFAIVEKAERERQLEFTFNDFHD